MSMKHPVEHELDYLEQIDYTKSGWQQLIDIRGYTIIPEINKLREFAQKGYSDQVTEACNAKADEWQSRLDAIIDRIHEE